MRCALVFLSEMDISEDGFVSEDDDDPVVSVALRKRRRALALAVQRDETMEDDASGEESDDKSSCESGDDDVAAQRAHAPERVARMRQVVEGIEFSIRNVGLSIDYVALVEPELSKLQATCKVHANQAISDRWSVPFVALLKRSRQLRVQSIPHAQKVILRERATSDSDSDSGRCQVCGTREHRCDHVFELVGAPPKDPNATLLGSARLDAMAEAYNDMDDADECIGADGKGVDEYFGMFACGQTCFEKAITAFLAHNFITNVAYAVRKKIDAALARDPALATQWQQDERDPSAVIESITASDAFAEQLLTKLGQIESALRGSSLGALLPRQTGNPGTWERIDAALLREAGMDQDTLEEDGREDVLRVCARHARRSLAAFGDEPDESFEDEPDDESFGDEDEVVILSESEDETGEENELVSSRTRSRTRRNEN